MYSDICFVKLGNIYICIYIYSESTGQVPFLQLCIHSSKILDYIPTKCGHVLTVNILIWRYFQTCDVSKNLRNVLHVTLWSVLAINMVVKFNYLFYAVVLSHVHVHNSYIFLFCSSFNIFCKDIMLWPGFLDAYKKKQF